MFVLSYSTGCLSDPCRIALYGAGSPARDRTDDKQRSDSQYNSDREGYEPVVNQRCDEVADKRYACYSHGVRKLRCNVIHMIALRPRRCHDGGVRDGRTVVAAHGTRQTRRDADEQQVAVSREDVGHDGNQDAEGAPRSAGSECQPAGDKEDDSRQEQAQTARSAFHQLPDKSGGIQKIGHVLKRSCERQNEDSGNHGDKALRNAPHCFPKIQETPCDQVNGDEHQRDQTAPRKSDKSVGRAECRQEITRVVRLAEFIGTEKAAHIHKPAYTGHDKNHDRNNQIPQTAARVDRLSVPGGILFQCAAVTALGADLKSCHLAIIKAHNGQCYNEHNCQQGVEIVRDGADKQLQPTVGFAVHTPGDSRCPRGDGRYHADGRGGRINQVRQLDTGYPMSVCDGAHDRADGQTVEVIVDEDHYAQKKGCDGGTHAGADMLLCPTPKGMGSARAVDHTYDNAQYHQENKNTGTVGDGTCQSLADDGIQGSGGIAPRVQQGTDDDTDKQRGIYFFGNQRQRDCDDRGKQCPSCRLSTGCVRQDKRYHNDAQRNGKRDDRGDGSQAGV